MDGAALHELIETEGVTFSAAVPTIWQMLLLHLLATGGKLATLNRVVIGGCRLSGVPDPWLRDHFGVEVVHAWGMTELSPLGTLGSPTAELAQLPFEAQLPKRLKQGRVPLGVDIKLVDDSGTPVAQNGSAYGRLLARGPAVAAAYFRHDAPILDADGWFDTGDIATIDADGYMQITDRAKDLIKSGGEWISSTEIENIASGHPKAALAAVIGRPHPKWDERPLLLVQLKEGEAATAVEMLTFLEGRIAKWWMPDEVLFVERIPLGPTGKIDKKALRSMHVVGNRTPA